MKISALCRPGLVTAEPWETLQEAASRMQTENVSALAVLADDEVVGILTERDLARALARSPEPKSALVSEFMSDHPVKVTADAEASEAATLMLELDLRHLPVVEGGRVVGMVSARDLLCPGPRAEHEVLIGPDSRG